jgi:hypothetical protein
MGGILLPNQGDEDVNHYMDKLMDLVKVESTESKCLGSHPTLCTVACLSADWPTFHSFTQGISGRARKGKTGSRQKLGLE